MNRPLPRRTKIDSRDLLALDKGSVRSFDGDGRMHVSVANISKAVVNPYRGEEIPGWEELGLERDKIYHLLRDPRELEAAAPTFNGLQLLRKHVPVSAEDHQMWDIVGCTGTEAKFDGKYLTNSLHIWTQEGIDFIESGDQREISCGYHYVPDMTAGNFNGTSYDGVMRNIEGNHVALVEEGRAGPDVVVGDSALKKRKSTMRKPTRLEYAVLMGTARAINPLLATDAKINYGPILKGLNSKNFKERKPQIVSGIKKAIAGKTIAQDASIEHLAKMLDTFEHNPPAEKSWDESVSAPQHKAMEAAAEGKSNLDIPKSVGKEFSEADKGKKFGDMIRDWAMSKDWSNGLSEDDIDALDKMHCDAAMPEAGKSAMDKDDGEENTEIDVEEGEDSDIEEEEAEDGDLEEEEAEDADLEEAEAGKDKDKAAKDKAAKDKKAKDAKAAKDRKGSAMDGKRPITGDDMNKAIASAVAGERKAALAATEARAFVQPFVGHLPIALDSAEKILRAAAKTMRIEDADTVHHSALKTLISLAGKSAAIANDHQSVGIHPEMAMDGAEDFDSSSFDRMFPDAGRIRPI